MMRTELVNNLIKLANDPKFIFLTGDLGFNALEPLQDKLGDRFINCGIAEQNMVGVAAGLAMQGYRPWIYSIAPFLYARALEQIRNDVCFNNLPVTLIGNGGGYSYGIMGPSHHAVEDYAILDQLPNMKTYIPAFREDINLIINTINCESHPSYIRLANSEDSNKIPSQYPGKHWEQWAKIYSGEKGTLIVSGPITNHFINKANNINLWVLKELPMGGLPSELYKDLEKSKVIVSVEEHNRYIAKDLAYYSGMRIIDYSAEFASHTGTQQFLRDNYILNIDGILREFRN